MRYFFVFLMSALTLSTYGQKNIPWLGTIKWVNGYERALSGESIGYFSAFPEDATTALLTRVTDGHKTIEWESAVVPGDVKGGYVYFSWVASHSSGTSTGDRNFDLFLNDEKLLTITTLPKNATPDWTIAAPDSTRIVFLQMKRDRVEDAHGVIFLRVPVTKVKPGSAVRFKMVGQAQNSADWFMTFKYAFQEKIEISPSSFLLKNGKQTLLVHALHFGNTENVTVQVNGKAVQSQTLRDGTNAFEVPVDDVRKPDSVRIRIASPGHVWADKWITLAPVKKRTIYILPHSHVDIGYTDLQSRIEDKQVDNLVKGMEYAERTKDYPEDSRFVWNLEGTYTAWLFLHRMRESQQATFLDAVRKGRVSINGMFLNTLTGLCRPEELLRLFQYGTELEKKTGVGIDAAMISDVPGYAWGTVTAMAQAGIKYFSVAPNYGDRIGTILQQNEEKPFYWVSPSGKEKVLVWIPYKGYALSHGVPQLDEKFVASYLRMLEERLFPYDISYMRWSGHGDNAVPEIEVSDFVRDWNAKYEWPHFIISSASRAFTAFEKKYGDQLPEYRGDWTGYWEDGAGSSALETGMNRNSSSRLTQAGTLWAMRHPGNYPREGFSEAWRHVLLFSEHTWGADISVSTPLSPKTLDQWQVKRGYALAADSLSHLMLTTAVSSDGNMVNSDQVDVINTNSWTRKGLVLVPAVLSRSGDQIKDEKGNMLPSQRLSTGELAFVAVGLPPFSTRRYTIVPGRSGLATPFVQNDTMLDNGILSLALDATHGGIRSLRMTAGGQEYVDSASGHHLNEYLYLEGSDPAGLQKNGPVRITVKENGPVLKTLLVTSEAPGCTKLMREVRLVHGFDYAEVTNTLDKKPALLNPVPGDYQWANTGGKESVHFAFPFLVPGGSFTLDLPFAQIRPDRDQIPGSCKNWMEVGDWADLSNDRSGITWATLDAPLVEIGEVSANLLGGQSDPAVWRKVIGTGHELYSWALNNHWETNYRASQEGLITFRYALRPHAAYDPAAATRFAKGLSQPLLVTRTTDKGDGHSLLTLSSEQVIVLALHPTDDGKALLVTLFNAADRMEHTRLDWASPMAATYYSDTGGLPIGKLDGEVEIAPLGVVTLRVER